MFFDVFVWLFSWPTTPNMQQQQEQHKEDIIICSIHIETCLCTCQRNQCHSWAEILSFYSTDEACDGFFFLKFCFKIIINIFFLVGSTVPKEPQLCFVLLRNTSLINFIYWHLEIIIISGVFFLFSFLFEIQFCGGFYSCCNYYPLIYV